MRFTRALSAVPVGLALIAAGCGGEKTDVSGGVDDYNQQLRPEGVSIDCPKEVNGGEGTTFDCTMKGRGGQSKTVQLRVAKEGDDLVVAAANEAEFNASVKEVGGR